MSLAGHSEKASAKLILEIFAWVTGEIIICSGLIHSNKPILFSMKRLIFNNEGIRALQAHKSFLLTAIVKKSQINLS